MYQFLELLFDISNKESYLHLTNLKDSGQELQIKDPYFLHIFQKYMFQILIKLQASYLFLVELMSLNPTIHLVEMQAEMQKTSTKV